MLSITDLKPGMTIEYKNEPWEVLSAVHSKIARGGAILKTKLKNLLTGVIIEKTFSEKDKFEKANLNEREVQFLYRDGSNLNFMDSKTFEQISLSIDLVREKAGFLKEGESLKILEFKEKPIDIKLPSKVILQVIETEPGLKGDRETAGTKPAKLETGMVVQVPLFIKKGDFIKIDTRSKEYVERA